MPDGQPRQCFGIGMALPGPAQPLPAPRPVPAGQPPPPKAHLVGGNAALGTAPTSGSGTHMDANGNLVDDATGAIVKAADTGQRITPQGFDYSNLLMKDNPIAGTVRAGVDLAGGNVTKAGADFAQGAGMGTVPIPGQTGLLPPAQTVVNDLPNVGPAITGAANAVGDAAKAAGTYLDPGSSGGTTGTVDPRLQASVDSLNSERAGFTGSPAPMVGNVQVDQTQVDPLRQRQNTSLDQLTESANGTAPSVAELQAKQQAERAAAQQFGMASALQGGLSAGGALRQASGGAAQLQADVANQGQINRAAEMAGARKDLVGALSGVRGQEQDLGTTNAGLTQQGNLANQNSGLQTTGQNFDWQKALLNGGLTAEQIRQKAISDANANAVAARNGELAYKGALVGGGAKILGGLLS